MSKRFSHILASVITALTNVQSLERAARNRLLVRDLLTLRHIIETQRGRITLICKERREVHYAHHFFDREPETLEWIDSFESPCTFWDVGANIGIYSLYAALAEDVEVYAFEPASSSYASMCANINANFLDNRIVGLCMGFCDKTGLAELLMSSNEAGAAMHDFGTLGSANEPATRACPIQRTIAFSIDDFRHIFDLRPINYLKVDVDNVEEAILRGATLTLCDDAIRSILVENRPNDQKYTDQIIEIMEKCGFANRRDINDQHDMIFSR